MNELSVRRQVVVGRHSQVWRLLAPRVQGQLEGVVAIGHGELKDFGWRPSDHVWLMSYSRSTNGNAAMLEALRRAGVEEIVYVSSSSTIVDQRTRCYQYPRVKAKAESDAMRLPNARVLTLGLMHESPTELPPGPCMATSYEELAAFFVAPLWPARRDEKVLLFRRHDRPFRNPTERWLHRAYGRALRSCGAFPCLLRSFDALLRVCGIRWYGYVYLSNALWISRTS